MWSERHGEGEPLLLLHGTGSYARAWDRVVPALAAHAETIAVDLPGFGQSPPLPEPLTALSQLVDAVEAFLDAEGIERPHVAGNSGGAWIALELAKRGRARTVVALAPMGLWRTRSGRSPLFARANFHLSHRAARLLRRWHEPILRSRAGRTVFMSQVMGRPWALTPEEALDSVRNFVGSPSVMDAAAALAAGRFEGGAAIDVPVTVAYGERDRALLKHHRRRDELPAHARWLTLPGCGHVPMADDPALVSDVILDGTVRRSAATQPSRSPASSSPVPTSSAR